jgi:hypothetical protein
VTGAETFRSPLLDTAAKLLRSAGFSIRQDYLTSAGAPWLLAEDEFFIVAITAADSFKRIREVEAFAATELIELLEKSEVGGKRWDAYLVLLSEDAPEDPDQRRQLIELQYNTRAVRRLVSLGVTEDPQVIARALRPFLPLPTSTEDGLPDAFAELAQQLVVNGIEREKAERYVAAFSETGSLDDV